MTDQLSSDSLSIVNIVVPMNFALMMIMIPISPYAIYLTPSWVAVSSVEKNIL